MSILKANVDLAVSIFKARIGDEYVFGGAFSPTDVQQGTDCSGMCDTILQALTAGPGMQWGRHVSTESWPYDYGNDLAVAVGTVGPYGTICAGDAQPGPPPTQYPPQIPSDAAAIIYLMHGGGGENSHMMIAVNDGAGSSIVMETGGDHNDTGGNGPYASPNGPATPTDDPEWTDIWYLPGPVDGGTPAPPPPPLSKADQYALIIIQTGQQLGITPRGVQIALATALVESNLTMYANSNDPASLNYPHDAVGSDHMSVGLFQQQDQGWGPLSCRMDAACSATTFYQHLERLNYNDPNQSPGSFAQAVQVSAFPDRYDQRFNDAVALYNRLVNLPPAGDDMAAVPQAQWDDLYQALCTPVESQSPFRTLGEQPTWTRAQMLSNIDGFDHPSWVEWAATRGSATELARLEALALASPAQYPDRAADIVLAQTVLARVQAAQSGAAPAPVTPAVAPAVAPAAPTPAPAPAPAPDPGKNAIGPAGWVGLAGTLVQGVLWVLQATENMMPPQWAAVASGLIAGATALGIYKAPNTHKPAAAPTKPPPAPPPPPPAPAPAPTPQPASGSIEDTLAHTRADAEHLAQQTEQIRKNLG